MAVLMLTVPAEADGFPVEALIRQWQPDLPESVLRKVFEARDVKLDGLRVRRDTPVRSGQGLSLFLPASRKDPFLDVVYEDADVLLVNKRAGISVEADAGGGLNLTELCRQYLLQQDPEAQPPRPCHRLDHQTCGLCLFARNDRAYDILLRVFKERTLEKYYICLVRGIPKPPSAVCRAWLLRNPDRASVRILDAPKPGAKPILTGYETLSAGPVSRLRVHLITGRTHQIRAHLAALGHPILGDDLYGSRELNRAMKARSLKLCAVSLKLDTGGALPQLDQRIFEIDPPF